MSQRSGGWTTRAKGAAALLVLSLLVPCLGRVEAVGPLGLPRSSEPRVPVATAVAAQGFRSSEGSGFPWKRVETKDRLYSRDLLLALPGLRSKLEPRPNSVELTLWGNLPQLSDSPVLESAVILHDTRSFDLDFTLVRGRVVLTNNKLKGPAKIWLRRAAGVELVLEAPGDSVALELAGRWPTGVPFKLNGGPRHVPIELWEIYVLKGRLAITTGKTEYTMEFPGPAYFSGDNVMGPDEAGPQRRTSLPAWADPKAPAPPEAKVIASVVEKYRAMMKANTDAEEVGAELLASAAKDKDAARASMTRQLVVAALAALDNVDRVLDALDNTTYPDMRRSAVVSLRHWIGAAPGRDDVLYAHLVDEHGYTKAQADTLLQLLHSPFQADQPETYEALIAYLKHTKLGVRELALWHLHRLAPSCRDVEYNPAAPAAARAKGYDAWKARIPTGELPPPVKKGKKAGTAS